MKIIKKITPLSCLEPNKLRELYTLCHKDIKKPSESFGFLEKLYVLCYMKKLKTLSIYSFMMLFPDEASALRYI